MKRLLTLIIILFLLTISVVSATYTISIKAINNTVLPFESATYELTVNSQGTDDIININTNANNWILTPQTLVVQANQTIVRELLITPKSGTGLSNYRIPLHFESARTGQEYSDSVFLSISYDLLTHGYPVNVFTNVTSLASVDPRDDYVVKVMMRNNNLRNIENLKISISSDLFTTEFTTPLEPLSVVRKEFSFDINDLLSPGKHELLVRITTEEADKTLYEESSIFEVKGYAIVNTDSQEIENSFFKKVTELTLTNTGNEQRTRTVSYEMSWLEKMFSSSDRVAEVTKNENGYALSWPITLAAQSEEKILITTNYRPIAYAVLIIIAVIFGYFLFRSPIIMFKETRITKQDEAGSSEMKVRVYIKNRSRNTIHNLKVIDRVPRIAEMIMHAHLGTLQPTKVAKSEKKGTVVRWEIEALEPYEERIISYNIKSKLKIVGSMSLPEAKVKFDTIAGRERIASSGPAQVMK